MNIGVFCLCFLAISTVSPQVLADRGELRTIASTGLAQEAVWLDESATLFVKKAGSVVASIDLWDQGIASGRLVVNHKIHPEASLVLVHLQTLNGKHKIVFLKYAQQSLQILHSTMRKERIEFTEFGVIKYVDRFGVDRCDGKPAFLDAERFDFGTVRFRKARQTVRVPVDGSVATLHSERRSDEFSDTAKGLWFRPSGASSSTRADSADQLVPPIEVSDGNEKTAWVENQNGFGRGEFLTFKSRSGPVQVKALRMTMGHGADRRGYNRPKRLALVFGKQSFWVNIDSDSTRPLWISLPAAVRTDCMTVIIDDVYPRTASTHNRGQTAIAEIEILSEEDRDATLGAKHLAGQIAAGRGRSDVARLLAQWGTEAAPALIEQIGASSGAESKKRLRLALAQIPAAPEELARGMMTGAASVNEVRGFTEGLTELGVAGVAGVAKALRVATRPDSVARLSEFLALSPLDAASGALLAVLGQGGGMKQLTVARALGRRQGVAAEILSRLTEEENRQALPGLVIALSIAAEHTSAANRAVEVLEQLYRNSSEYELRYRILQGLGPLGGAKVLRRFVQRLATATSPEELALLRVGYQSLLLHGDSELGDMAISALRHPDVGVRLSALRNMIEGRLLARDTSGEVVAEVAVRLREDLWSEAKVAAAEALGQGCDQGDALRALTDSTLQERDVNVARTALHGLLQCNAPGNFALLMKLLDTLAAPHDLRRLAAQNSAVPTTASEDAVVQRFVAARQQGLADGAQVEIAADLAIALQRWPTARVVALLESSAVDPGFPRLQAASLQALGRICGNSSMVLMEQLSASESVAVARAAKRARQSCASPQAI